MLAGGNAPSKNPYDPYAQIELETEAPAKPKFDIMASLRGSMSVCKCADATLFH
jgi:hypothetical protein